jgi:hypothetical protein
LTKKRKSRIETFGTERVELDSHLISSAARNKIDWALESNRKRSITEVTFMRIEILTVRFVEEVVWAKSIEQETYDLRERKREWGVCVCVWGGEREKERERERERERGRKRDREREWEGVKMAGKENRMVRERALHRNVSCTLICFPFFICLTTLLYSPSITCGQCVVQ